MSFSRSALCRAAVNELAANAKAPIESLTPSMVNALKNAFIDAPNRRCTLCGDNNLVVPRSHHGSVSHRARLGIVERALSGVAGVPPMELPKRTWENLHTAQRSPNSRFSETLTFDRIPSLSATSGLDRRSRVCYLLQFLVDRGSIKNSLNLAGVAGIARDRFFETYEMVGDNTVKYILQDRLFAMFPVSQGNVSSGLLAMINLLDSNEGLRSIFDYLRLETIVGVHLPNSKMKSDVVESLFGELQVRIWASEIRHETEEYESLKAPEHRYLITLMRHVLSELGHILLQWAVDETMDRAKSFVDEHKHLLHHFDHRAQETNVKYARLPVLQPAPKPNTHHKPSASNEHMSYVRNAHRNLAAESKPSPSATSTTPLRCVRDRRTFVEAAVRCAQELTMHPTAEQHDRRGRRRSVAKFNTAAAVRRQITHQLLHRPDPQSTDASSLVRTVEVARLFSSLSDDHTRWGKVLPPSLSIQSHPSARLLCDNSKSAAPHVEEDVRRGTKHLSPSLMSLVNQTIALNNFVAER